MMYNHLSWSIEIQPDWVIAEAQECVTVYNADGVGAFQLSSARKEAGYVTDEDLLDSAGNYLAHADVVKMSLGDFSGWRSQYKEDQSYWRTWHLRAHDVILFATYNCSAEDAGKEDAEVDAMMRTLRFTRG